MISLIADAVGYARLSQETVFEIVIPLLPPQRRGLAEDIQRMLAGDHFISEAFLRDLAALVDFLGREIANGTQHGWIADEHDVNGGRPVKQFSDHALALIGASDHLIDLHRAISDVLNYAKAGRLAETLFEH
ncbi:MAG: hypothetical protein ACSHWZ_00035 [Sulfitobacter sp.]